MPSPTPTTTPTITPIVCGSGITQTTYVYYDCCGYVITGDTPNQIVSLDYTKPHAGITLLYQSGSPTCPTPTPTLTNTLTHTYTPSVTQTLTNTLTPTLTPTKQVSNTTNRISNSTSSSAPSLFGNTCDTFMTAPLGIKCRVLSNVSSANANDGSLALFITGGTPPYTIYWNNIPNNSEILTNLPAGNYEALVVDYYGDYSARTSCFLLGGTPLPTQTLTQTITPTATLPVPCFCFKFYVSGVAYAITLNPLGLDINGNLTWQGTSNDINQNPNQPITLSIVFNPVSLVWTATFFYTNTGTSGVFNNFYFTSPSTSNIPLSGWYTVGSISSTIQPTFTYSTNCSTCGASQQPLVIQSITTTDASCGNQPDGSVTVVASGGIPPLIYTLDNGIPQNNGIFASVAQGTHSITVTDNGSPANTITNNNVIVNFANTTVTYILSLRNLGNSTSSSQGFGTTTTNTQRWRVDVNPALPPGVTLTFDLKIESNQRLYEPGVGIITSQSYVDKNNNQVFIDNTNIVGTNTPRPGCDFKSRIIYSGITDLYNNITLTANDTITGTCTSILTVPQGGGSVDINGCITQLQQDIRVSIINVSIAGCACCSSQFDGTPVELTDVFATTDPDPDQFIKLEATGVHSAGFQQISAISNFRIIWGDASPQSFYTQGSYNIRPHVYNAATFPNGYTGNITLKINYLYNLDTWSGFNTVPAASPPSYYPLRLKTLNLINAWSTLTPTPLGMNQLVIDNTSCFLDGVVTDLPPTLTKLWVLETNLGGRIDNLPKLLDYVRITGNNSLLGYSAKTWSNGMKYVEIFGANPIQTDSTTFGDIDKILRDLSLTTWTGDKIIRLKGVRSAGSDAYYNALFALGVSITITT